MIPRNEHPRPQFMRESFINLNGEWEFEIDNSMSGKYRGFENKHLNSKNKTIQCTDNWKAINNIEQVLFVIIDIVLFIHINTIAKWQYETTNYKRKSGKRKRKEGNNMFKHG